MKKKKIFSRKYGKETLVREIDCDGNYYPFYAWRRRPLGDEDKVPFFKSILETRIRRRKTKSENRLMIFS